MPGMVAVAVAGKGVLLLATTGVNDAMGVAVNGSVAVGIGQPSGISQEGGGLISRGVGGLVLL